MTEALRIELGIRGPGATRIWDAPATQYVSAELDGVKRAPESTLVFPELVTVLRL